MKFRSIMTVSPSALLRTSLLAVILLVSCAPVAGPAPAEPESPVQPAPAENEPPVPPPPTPTMVQPEAAPTEAASAEVQPTEAPTEVPQAVATSRGPDLEATDPTTVSLDSGDLQFVEFFRFT